MWGPSVVRLISSLINNNHLSVSSQVSELGLSKESDGSNCQLLRLKSLDLSFNKVGRAVSSSVFTRNFYLNFLFQISSFLPEDLSLAPGLQSLNLKGKKDFINRLNDF